MKKSLIKVTIVSALFMGLATFGPSTVKANSDTSSDYYGSYYGNLVGENQFYKQPGSPLAKRVDLSASVQGSVDYVGVKLSVKNYSTGSNYYSSGSYGRAGTYYHTDWDFLKSENASIYNNQCSAFGTHEFRHSSSGVVYTVTYA